LAFSLLLVFFLFINTFFLIAFLAILAFFDFEAILAF